MMLADYPESNWRNATKDMIVVIPVVIPPAPMPVVLALITRLNMVREQRALGRGGGGRV
jgi:hypothetical protein